MSRWPLMGTLGAMVVVLTLGLVLVGLAAWQAREPAVAEESHDPRPHSNTPASIYVLLDKPTQDGDSSVTGQQALKEVEAETQRVTQGLAALVESLRRKGERDSLLAGIRDQIDLIVRHLSPPINVRHGGSGPVVDVPGEGITGNVRVHHHIESISEEVVARIRDALASVAITVDVEGGGSATAGCRLLELRPVTGFPIEEHEPSAPNCTLSSEDAAMEPPACAAPRQSRCEAVAASFWEQLNGRGLGHLVLIGRADRMPFDNVRYGGNRGLAQARAKWVHDCLRRELPREAAGVAQLQRIVDVLENRTMLLSAGPLHVPACHADVDCDTKTRSRDRGVDLFACLDEPVPAASVVSGAG